MNRVWERVALALVVCVPVPALALSGLNVPLPSVVERIAAALVPFGNDTVLDGGSALAAGRIVRTADLDDVGAPADTRAAVSDATIESEHANGAAPTATAPETAAREAADTELPTGTVAGGAKLEEPVPAPEEGEPAPSEEPAAPEEPARDPAPAPAPTPVPSPNDRKKIDPTPTKEPTKVPDVNTQPLADVVDSTPVEELVENTDPPRLEEPPRTPTKPADLPEPVKDAIDSAADVVYRVSP